MWFLPFLSEHVSVYIPFLREVDSIRLRCFVKWWSIHFYENVKEFMKLHLLTYFAITFSLWACVDVMITLFIKNYNGIDTLSDVSVHLCKTGALQLEIRALWWVIKHKWGWIIHNIHSTSLHIQLISPAIIRMLTLNRQVLIVLLCVAWVIMPPRRGRAICGIDEPQESASKHQLV